MDYKDLQNLSYLSRQVISESTQLQESYLDKWPYTTPYLTEEEGKAKPKARLSREIIRRGKQEEGFDLYDLIFAHLVNEGFAETQEAAIAIMSNMSEAWVESIVDYYIEG